MTRIQLRVIAAAAAVTVAALVAAGGWGTVTRTAVPELAAAPLAETMSQAEITTQEIAFFTERANADPQGAADRATLAGLYLQRSRETGSFEDYRHAETFARESIALRSARNSHAHRILAAALLTQHRFTEARAAAEQLVALFPDEPAHRALLGEIQLELGDYEAAGATFDGLRREHEHMAVAPRLARWAEVRGDREGELAALRSVAHKALYRSDLPREQVAWFHLRLADHLIRFGAFDEARTVIATGLAEEPNDHRLVALLARVAAVHGQWDAVIAYGARIGDAADLRTIALIGDAYAARGDSAAAERQYERLEASVAENPEPYNRQWTQFRVDHGRNLPETLALLRREAQTRRDVLGYDLLAWALYKSGEYAEARLAMQQALRMNTQDASFHYHAGMIELALGNDDAGRRHLSAALGINPRFHHVHAARARAELARKPSALSRL